MGGGGGARSCDWTLLYVLAAIITPGPPGPVADVEGGAKPSEEISSSNLYT